jgi:hypothetical protein
MLASGTFGGLVVSMLASGTFGGLVVNMLASGTFGGLMVSMLSSGTPRSRVRIRQKKIHSMPSFGGEVKPSAKCRRFAACKKTLAIYVEVGTAGKIDRPFLAHNSVLH